MMAKQRTKGFDKGLDAFRAFTAAARKMRPTRRHRPALWECMFATVYAANSKGEVRYFDYNYAEALKHIGPHSDVRVARVPESVSFGDHVLLRGQLAWFVIYEEA